MKKLPIFYALVMQASNNIYLFVVSCEITPLIQWAGGYESQWKRGELPQSASLHCRGNISCVEGEVKNKNRSRPLQPIVNIKHLSFFQQKISCELSVQSTSSVQTEEIFQTAKEAISSLCSLCATSNNEHIIIRQVWEVPLTYNDVSTEMSC